VERNRSSNPATLSIFGFAIGSAVGGFIFRLLLIPTDLGGRTNTMLISEGDIGSYIVRALLFALFAGIAGAAVALTHNEVAKRS
jgi:hypothetical protein